MPGRVRKSNRGGAPEVQRERAAATRAAIVQAARALFAGQGFHATGTTEIVTRAMVTRGALYHHFADKEDLFAEVFRVVAEELVRRSNTEVAPLSGQLWAQMKAAFRQYLQLVASTGEYQRILLIDGPVVLGWSKWRALQSEFVASGIAQALQMAMDRGIAARQKPEPLANLIQAALNDAALSIANSDTPRETAGEVTDAFDALLEGLRKA